MYKNYFYILRCIQELKPILEGRKIAEIYSQEKDKLFFHIPFPDKPNFHLIVSINFQEPFISIREEHHKAKKNTINFFGEFLPIEIDSIDIALGDRIIRMSSSNGTFTIIFRGGKSNILFADSMRTIHPFKKLAPAGDWDSLDEIAKNNFINNTKPFYELISKIDDENTLKKMPSFGKDILEEAGSRTGGFRENLFKVLDEINNDKIVVYFDETSGKSRFHPKYFHAFRIPENHFEFDSYFEALNKYFALVHSTSSVTNVKKEIEKYLDKEIGILSNRLNNLKVRVDAGSKEKLYRHHADLLLANITLLRKGLKEIELNDYISDTKLIIKLEEKLSVNQNIDRYYDKSHSEKIEYGKSKELLSINQNEYERLIKIRDRFEMTEENEKLLEIKKELKIKLPHMQEADGKDKIAYRHFILENKYHLYVGKDSKNNDMLTTKFAKQNDFWFHARSVSGSHVVLRVENTKETVPKNILQKAASIAAFYSKAKTSKVVPVTYTLKKYVIKNQRHEPGQVTVTKEKVLLVKPEAPKESEMVPD